MPRLNTSVGTLVIRANIVSTKESSGATIGAARRTLATQGEASTKVLDYMDNAIAQADRRAQQNPGVATIVATPGLSCARRSACATGRSGSAGHGVRPTANGKIGRTGMRSLLRPAKN